MISPDRYGVSFSVKQCRNFGLDPAETLAWLLAQGWRRFRLMSYWNEHEKRQGIYDFGELDRQIAAVRQAGGIVTLCLGAKQPRWPEYHWPEWAWAIDKPTRNAALLKYIQTVAERYKGEPCIVSWQLENEALLSNFGQHIEIDRKRLRAEFQLIKRLDPTRPVAMSTSNGWGMPLRRPQPDMVGFSLYFTRYEKSRYRRTAQGPLLHALRRSYIPQPVFIHELQCEPWGPKAIWQMSSEEQAKSMASQQIAYNIRAAQTIGAWPIDLWGGEWWYWRSLQGNDSIWQTVLENVQ